jgi:hypothetical protein
VRRVVAAAALVVTLAGLVAAVARADTLCDSNYGTYCCNDARGLRLVMTYKSKWYGDKDYNAYRLRQDGTVSYHHYEAVSSAGEDPFLTFTNPVDALRQTLIQRGGSTSSSWQMWEWALGSCS